jgi:protein MpaA
VVPTFRIDSGRSASIGDVLRAIPDWRRLCATSALLGALAVLGCHERVHRAIPQAQARPVSHPRVSRRLLRHRLRLGTSVRRRPIVAIELGPVGARRAVLVVGCIHGNETAGIAIARSLLRARVIRGVDLWVIPNLNPDGAAAGTRQNADGVDLNRNFPYRWQPLGPRGTQQYAGPRPLSEPESRIAHMLIARLRPAVTIWFHQPLALVDESGGSIAVERRFARVARLPLRKLTRYPGSAAGWQDARIARTTAFVVELPPGRVGPAAVARYVRAVRAVATS